MSKYFNSYYATEEIAAAVSAGNHRNIVGGLWDEIGRFQLDTLIAHGLKPEHRLLDVGCGALRGGVHFIRYLAPAHYYGLDINASLLDAGYDIELGAAGLQERLPRDHLVATRSFEMSGFVVSFDRAIALSLFTHLPLDLIRVCLERLAPKMACGGIFHATFFEASEGQHTLEDIRHEPASIVTHAGADPFHHRFADFVYLARGLPWSVVYVGDFGHPRGQRLINFESQN